MKQVIKYVCEICHKEYLNKQDAIDCENSTVHKEWQKQKCEQDKLITELIDKGMAVWWEYDGMKHALKVDETKFGPHEYDPDHDVTSDCKYGCGCWMGPCRSGGMVDPFGACPKNPKTRNKNASRL